MSKPLNLNKLKKKTITVTLPDPDETTLIICTPTKEIMDEFIALQASMADSDDQADAIDNLYDVCAKIMTRNKSGLEITKEFVAGNMDFEDVIVFIKAYSEFIQEVSSGKN